MVFEKNIKESWAYHVVNEEVIDRVSTQGNNSDKTTWIFRTCDEKTGL